MTLSAETYLQHLRADGAALVAAAEKDLSAWVPSCPEWSMADLLRHTSQVHRNRTVLARLGDTKYPEGLEREHGPEAPEDLPGWYRAGLDELVAALEEVGPDAPTWTWTGENRVAFWIRRMAQETTVHRWDAQNALGQAERIDAELASDGVDEFLDAFIPGEDVAWKGAAGTIHLHCTDVEGEWTVTVESGRVPTYERGHTKGDVALRAAAHDLLMFVWRRVEPNAVEILGDADLARAFWDYVREPGQ